MANLLNGTGRVAGRLARSLLAIVPVFCLLTLSLIFGLAALVGVVISGGATKAFGWTNSRSHRVADWSAGGRLRDIRLWRKYDTGGV